MALSKAVSSATKERMPPQQVAERIVAAVPKNNVIEKMEVAGPGFINIHIRHDLIERELTKV